MRDLDGATAIVTGASRGVGPYIAHALGRRGVVLALIARSADELGAVATKLAGYRIDATPVVADLANDAGLERALSMARRALGRIDVVVNNAAVDALGPFHETGTERIDAVLRVNLRAALELARRVLPDMLAAGRGHIVNVASAAAAFGLPYEAVYAATKGALVAFTRSIR